MTSDGSVKRIIQKLYKGTLTTNGEPVLLKHRFKKTYRHASLDASLTKSRIAGEARALLKCLRWVILPVC